MLIFVKTNLISNCKIMTKFITNHLKALTLSIVGILLLSLLIVEIKRYFLNIDFENKISNFIDNRDDIRSGDLSGFDERDGEFYSIKEIASIVNSDKNMQFQQNDISIVFKPTFTNFQVLIITNKGRNTFELMKIKSAELGFRRGVVTSNVSIDKIYQRVFESLTLKKYDFRDDEYDRMDNFLDTFNDYYEINMKKSEGGISYNSILTDNYVMYLDSEVLFCKPTFKLVNYLTDFLIYFGIGLLIILSGFVLYYKTKNVKH